MASSLAQEDINFLRLAGLLIKIAPCAVRRCFDYEFHTGQLKQFLCKNRRKIDDLTYTKRVFTLAQYDLLYPKGSSGVSSDMFDVSLMVCLLRNFTDIDIQDNLPLETIHTTAADISRIKFYRNYIVHSDSGKVTENTFSEIGNCVIEAILRLVPDLKSEIDAMMSSPLTNDIKDLIRLEKQMENINQHLRTVSRKMETLEIESNNIKEIYIKTLKEWKEKDLKYISTAASTFILQSLNQNRGVIITGSPGCGKSIVAHHAALTFEKEGYEIIPCDSPSDILKHFTAEKIQVFVIDDICGKFALNQHKADFWEQNDGKLNMLLCSSNENDDNDDISSKSEAKFIFTCRENIYSHKAFPKLTCFSLVQCSFSTTYKISPDEMRKIALSYLPENTVNNIENICLYDFFPLLCALYGKKIKQNPDFFNHPVEVFEKEISDMKFKCETSFLVLSLLVLKNNKFCKNELISSDLEHLVKAICRDAEIESNVSMVSIQNCLKSLQGIYITESEKLYTAIHDKMFDIISAAIAPYIMNCLIEYADIAFVAHRIQLSSCGQRSLPFVVYIPPELEESYLKRQYNEALKGNNWEVFGSIQTENQKYRKLLLSFLKEQDTCQETIYVVDKDGASPFFVSSYLGYVDFVEYFRVKSPGHIDGKDTKGRSSFFVACENGHILVVKYLMKYIHDINAENSEKTTALSATCLNGHTEVAQLLLENKAETNKTNNSNQSTIHFACSHGNVKLVQLLLNGGYNVDLTVKDHLQNTALHIACERGHSEIVKTLMELGMEVNQKQKHGRTPLYIACKHGCYKTVKCITDFIYLKIKKRTIADELKNVHTRKSGWTVLHSACNNGHTDVVKLLIDVGMTVNDLTTKGFTPLFLACRIGHKDTVKFLLDLKGQTLNKYTPLEERWTVLHIACLNGHTEVVKLLIDVGMNVNDALKDGSTPLHLACQNGHHAVVKLLLDLKEKTLNSCVDTTVKDEGGWSVLHIACSYGHTEVVKLLVDVGMNVNDKSTYGFTPLLTACQTGHYDTVKLLLDLNGKTLNSRVDTTIKTKNRWSCLHVACSNGHTAIVQILIDLGMNVNDTIPTGETPLLLACKKGHYATVKYLLDLNGQSINSRVDVTLKDKEGTSALHAAISAGHLEIVKLLSDVGMNATDK